MPRMSSMLKMKNKIILIIIALCLGACAAPTASLSIDETVSDKTGYLFYQNEDEYLLVNELKVKLSLPAKDYVVPTYHNLLPNAKREYRSGHHLGIDFSAPMGYPIRAVYDGVVVRSNNTHEDVDIETYNSFLATSSKLGKTPEDIYNYILLGKSIIIDHGYAITSKYRSITVYSHLSSIPESIKPGVVVKEGDLIGYSGNTGTSSGALRNDKGAHLHWEIFFDNKNGRDFLGQNIPTELLKENIDQLFK